MKFKKISADEVHSVRKDHFRGDSDVMLKAARSPSTWDETNRSARFVMSAQTVDRYGDIVVTQGLNLDNFQGNPVALLNHNSSNFSIGEWKNVEKMTRTRPPRMEGDLVFHDLGAPDETIDKVELYVKKGIMKGASIGFIPNWDAVELNVSADDKVTGFKFNEAELVECSVCNLPANPAALAKDISGWIPFAKEFLDEMREIWEMTDDGMLIPRDYDNNTMLEYAEACARIVGMELLNPEIEQRIPKKQYMQMQSLAAHNRRIAQLRRELDIRKSRTF